MKPRTPLSIAALTAAAALVGCDPEPTGPLASKILASTPGASQSPNELGPEICAFGQEFALDPDNAFYPLAPGSYWILEGEEDETPLRLRIDVTEETEDVGGVTTRVVIETEWEYDDDAEEWELVEVSFNYFAGTADGTVCYFGEAVDDYEDGEIVSHEGAWRADEPGNHAGVFMPGEPRPGLKFQMEGAPGVAEDRGKIVAIGPTTVPAGTFLATIRLREYNPLDEEKDYKVFAEGVGTIVDGPLALVEYEVQ